MAVLAGRAVLYLRFACRLFLFFRIVANAAILVALHILLAAHRFGDLFRVIGFVHRAVGLEMLGRGPDLGLFLVTFLAEGRTLHIGFRICPLCPSENYKRRHQRQNCQQSCAFDGFEHHGPPYTSI